MDHEDDNEIRALAAQLSKAIQENDITSFNLTYTGGGDSTDGFDVTIEPIEKQELAGSAYVDYQATKHGWSQTEGNYERVKACHETLEDAAYNLAEMLWNRAGQGGWYNNEGGGGELNIYPAGTFEFRHYNNVQTEEEACHWRANVLVGPVDAPYEETALEPTSP